MSQALQHERKGFQWPPITPGNFVRQECDTEERCSLGLQSIKPARFGRAVVHAMSPALATFATNTAD
jgi:hypothetical protein